MRFVEGTEYAAGIRSVAMMGIAVEALVEERTDVDFIVWDDGGKSFRSYLGLIFGH
jgi:hypothetical protein